MPSAETIHVWICRHCGKRSYAKRDPIAHERRVYSDTDYGRRADFVWCGPFDRYVAALDTEKPQRDASKMPHLGQPSRPPVEHEEDPNAGIEVPF
ncbi:MAG TPA: hypothetical protein VN213_20250 [Solirubrobacteraceae bacterium]|nr:hypothetical protein [Solirubrobacteraceae bacterium]